MTVTTRVINDKLTMLTVDFSDEGVSLVGETEVVGDENKALSYAPFFEADLHREQLRIVAAEVCFEKRSVR